MNVNNVDRSLQDWLDAVEPRTAPDEILRNVFAVTRRIGQRRGPLGRLKQIARVGALGERMNRFVLVAGGTTALAIAVIGVAYLRGAAPDVGVPPAPTASPSPSPITGSLPAEQTAVIAAHVAALNSRDTEAFVDVFADDGTFNPRGTFTASQVLFASMHPTAHQSAVESFMAINEAWRFEAEVVTCDHGPNDVDGRCAVKSRWPALSLEISEWWFYEFDGTSIHHWGQEVRDAAPADRTLPLGLDGLLEWEAWLQSTDPPAAARLLNPRVYLVTTVSCGFPSEPPCEWASENVDVQRIVDGTRTEHDWVVAGLNFRPSGLIPYNPAHAAEIDASIGEFLTEQGGR